MAEQEAMQQLNKQAGYLALCTCLSWQVPGCRCNRSNRGDEKVSAVLILLQHQEPISDSGHADGLGGDDTGLVHYSVPQQQALLKEGRDHSKSL